MKRYSIPLISLLLVAFMAIPAGAAVSLNFNSNNCFPDYIPKIENGASLIHSSIAAQILGADITEQNGQFCIRNNSDTLCLTEGSKKAQFNGKEIALPLAPVKDNGNMILPLRAVLEPFGAVISWNAEKQAVNIAYSETRADMTAEKLMAVSSAKTQEFNSYKVSGSMDMDMETAGITDPSAPEKISLHTDLTAYYKKDPLTVYSVQQTKMPPNTADTAEVMPESIKVESLLTEDAMYTQIPEMGWVKMDLKSMGLDFKTLFEQAATQDPTVILKQMQDYGISAAFGNDITIDGQKYYVLDCMMDKDKLFAQYQKMLGSMSSAISQTPEMPQAINNTTMDLRYRCLINQNTYLSDYTDMNGSITIKLNIPDQKGINEAVSMKINMDGKFKISDYNLSFEIPDVSSAVDMDQLENKAE